MFVIVSRQILLRMISVSDKSCGENQNTRFKLNNFFSENRAVYEIMWKNIVQSDRPQVTIRRMCVTCWITKATDKHSEYVMLMAFSAATIVTRMYLNVAFIRTMPV